MQVSWSLVNNSLWPVVQQYFRYPQLQALYFDFVYVWPVLQDVGIRGHDFVEEAMTIV
jgi:hypothetical protein